MISLREIFVTHNVGVTQAHQSNSPAERFLEAVPVTPTNNQLASVKHCKHEVDKSPHSAAKERISYETSKLTEEQKSQYADRKNKEAIGMNPTGADA